MSADTAPPVPRVAESLDDIREGQVVAWLEPGTGEWLVTEVEMDGPEVSWSFTGTEVILADPLPGLPSKPTWGIAVHQKFDPMVGKWQLDGSEFWKRNGDSRSWRAHNVVAFIPLTDEQRAQIKAAR